jgi:membrane AbrB-like protein
MNQRSDETRGEPMNSPAGGRGIAAETFALLRALAGALIGGGVFAWLALPLPWLLGAIVGTAVLAMAGARVKVPRSLRDLVLVVLGLMIGATLRPEILGEITRWPLSLAGVIVYVAIATAGQYALFRRVGGYDAPTAYFSAAPGGFMAMTVLGGEFGGAERLIALTHAVRMVLVIFVIVLGYHALVGHSAGHTNPYVPLSTLSPAAIGGLIGVGAAGAAGARLLRLPAGAMIGPLVLMGAVKIGGLLSVPVPTGPILIAEVVLGSSVGAQFAGITRAELGRGFLLALSGALALLLLTVLFALALAAVTGMALTALMLAFAPGGMSGIALVALALHIEPAFVTAHNMTRVIVILAAGPVLFRACAGRD